MKRILLLFFVFVCFSNILTAKKRTVAEATQLAGLFINSSSSGTQKVPSITGFKLTLVYSSLKQKLSSENDAYYYVFEKGNDAGYVIVSGDDRAKTILGYTDEGHFDISALPENLKYWLSFYENEIKSLPDISVQTTVNDTNTLSKVKSISTSTLSAVAPLLGNIKWNQGSPYNNFCPVVDSINNVKAVTGCVATGMAQVMKYYNWPIQGTGSNSYITTTLKIAQSIDFSQTQYDWSNMSDTYSASSTKVQNDAVATLMQL